MITISTSSEAEAEAAVNLTASWPAFISYEIFLLGRRVAGRRAGTQAQDSAQWKAETELR